MGTSFTFDPSTILEIGTIVGTKGTPIIFSQNPPAGTPIPKGMQVEVKTFNPGDVPNRFINKGAHATVEDVPLEALIVLYRDDPFFKALKGMDTLPAAQRDQFILEINQKLAGKGLKGTVTPNDADAVFDSIKGAGKLGVNRALLAGGGLAGVGVGTNFGGATTGLGGAATGLGGAGTTGINLGGIGGTLGGFGG